MRKVFNWAGGLALSAGAVFGIMKFEGFTTTAYQDVVGIKTIGVGHTGDVPDKITPQRGIMIYRDDLDVHQRAILKCIGEVPLYDYELDAFTSLAFNIGTNAFCKSTLAKKLKVEDYQGACDEILRWDSAGGKKSAGLAKRRAKEHSICTGEGTWE